MTLCQLNHRPFTPVSCPVWNSFHELMGYAVIMTLCQLNLGLSLHFLVHSFEIHLMSSWAMQLKWLYVSSPPAFHSTFWSSLKLIPWANGLCSYNDSMSAQPPPFTPVSRPLVWNSFHELMGYAVIMTLCQLTPAFHSTFWSSLKLIPWANGLCSYNDSMSAQPRPFTPLSGPVWNSFHELMGYAVIMTLCQLNLGLSLHFLVHSFEIHLMSSWAMQLKWLYITFSLTFTLYISFFLPPFLHHSLSISTLLYFPLFSPFFIIYRILSIFLLFLPLSSPFLIVFLTPWRAGRSSEVEHSLTVRLVVRSILHGVDPLSYFSFQPVLHDWCNKGCGMCYPVCGMVHIKEPLLLIDKSSLWWQWVSFLTIRMVLNHMSDAI